MIQSLQLQYNRGRQAVITTELIDIITVSHRFNVCGELLLMRIGCLGIVSGCRCRWNPKPRKWHAANGIDLSLVDGALMARLLSALLPCNVPVRMGARVTDWEKQ